MLAVLDRDIIISIGRGDTEIGNPPRNVGLERLRYDGTQIVDLATLEGYWVEYHNGAFILHCIELEGTQYVAMRYGDRKRLMLDETGIRLPTPEEVDAKAVAETIAAAKIEFARLLEKQETLYEFSAFMLGLIACCIIYARTPNATLKSQIGAAMDNILEELQALPILRMTTNAEAKLTKIKELLESFYSKIDSTTTGG